MPRIAEATYHRLHIALEEDDYEWLKRQVGDERLISETIRHLIKNLRRDYEKKHPKNASILEEDT
jgi:hypothetical protein